VKDRLERLTELSRIIIDESARLRHQLNIRTRNLERRCRRLDDLTWLGEMVCSAAQLIEAGDVEKSDKRLQGIEATLQEFGLRD